MGIASCYHVIHAQGLTEMLKLGSAEGMDEQHYWDLVDNTYIDEVGPSLSHIPFCYFSSLLLASDLTHLGLRIPSSRPNLHL
jgi:hypothetical protein